MHQPRVKSPWTVVFPLLLALALIFGLRWWGNRDAKTKTEHQFSLFGTYGHITLWGPRPEAQRVIAEVVIELQKLNDTINVYDPESELSRLNQTAHTAPVACTPRLWAILQAARQAYVDTNGAFDISIGPLMKLWGFHQKRQSYPEPQEVIQARHLVGLDKIIFDDHAKTVSFPQPGMYLDFGGMAKGYALVTARQQVQNAGFNSALLDLGGNITCFTLPPPGRQAYRIGIRDPDDPTTLLEAVTVLDRTVATSGNYENFLMLDGKLVHHIIDPATGYPVPDVSSVTVITPNPLDSDIFSTAIFVKGPEFAKHAVTTHPGMQVIIVQKTAKNRQILRLPLAGQ